MGRWAFPKCEVTQYGCIFVPPNAAIIWSGMRMLCNATDLHIVVHVEVKGSDKSSKFKFFSTKFNLNLALIDLNST